MKKIRLNVLGASHEPDGELTEKVMTKKDIKKRDEIADAISTKDMKDRYGDKNVKYAIATKIVMDKKKKKKKKNINEQLGGTQQTLAQRKLAQANVEKAAKQKVITTNTKDGKLVDMSIGSQTASDQVAKVLGGSKIGGVELKMDADGLLPDAGGFAQKFAQKSFDKVKGSGLNKFLTPDQIKQGDANIAQLGNKINQDIPGTQAFRFKNVAMSINQKNLKASYDMEQSVTESDLIIQDWNKDDIKFTEIETVDVIKPKPLKEEHSNWRLDEKFRMIPKTFGKTVILGTGSSRMMGKSPRLSRGASINLAINKNMGITKDILNLSKQADDIAPMTFPRDVSRKIKKKFNPNAVFPPVAQSNIKNKIITDITNRNISPNIPSTVNKNPIKKKNIKKKNDDGGSLMASYDWRAELGEDWQKVNRQDKTDGLSKKAVKAYRRENPGSKLKTAVTKDPKKLKKGSKDAKRRLSFCRRMKGMKKRLTSAKTARDPDSRINKALRRWNC